jgi:hypothetical protein
MLQVESTLRRSQGSEPTNVDRRVTTVTVRSQGGMAGNGQSCHVTSACAERVIRQCVFRFLPSVVWACFYPHKYLYWSHLGSSLFPGPLRSNSVQPFYQSFGDRHGFSVKVPSFGTAFMVSTRFAWWKLEFAASGLSSFWRVLSVPNFTLSEGCSRRGAFVSRRALLLFAIVI